jgi:hypothetical protein
MTRILAALALLAPAAAHAYIEALYPLQQFMNESQVIAEGVLESADPKTKTAQVKILRSLKGKCAYPVLRLNIGAGQEWHPDAVFRHLVPGAPALFFFDGGGRAELYVNRFFMQLYADGQPPEKAWWTFTHIEIRCNRTYVGPADEFIKLVGDILAGKVKPPAPDPKIPPISRQDVAALPVWGQPVKPEELPASFRRRDPVRLLKPRDPENPTLPIKGLAYEYFEGTFEKLPDFGALTPARTGTCETFDLSKRGRDAAYAFRFTGYVDVPRDGVYTFTLSSNDGSKLFIGRDEVADNDHFHGVAEASGEIALKAGKHPIMVVYFQHGGNQVLEVFWEGPELPRQKIPASALFHTPAR